MSRTLSVMALVLGLSGCVAFSVDYAGNPIAEKTVDKIVVGKTTRAQVLKLLGSPLRIDQTDITGLVERTLARYEGEELTLKIDPSLFEDVYVYERKQTKRIALIFGVYNYLKTDERSDRLAIFFDKKGIVLGVGWTPGTKDL